MSPGALLLLGWSGFKSLVKRPFKAPRAYERVLRRGASERIVALEPDDRAAVRGASGCIACGRCDEALGAHRAPVLPSDWILCGLRDLTDRDLAAEPPAGDELLARMEAVCPVRVPFRALAAGSIAMAQRMGARRPI
jgi:hypothetical protein